MGLFSNKKKDTTPETGGGDYVAPSVAVANTSTPTAQQAQQQRTPSQRVASQRPASTRNVVATKQSFTSADPDVMSGVRSTANDLEKNASTANHSATTGSGVMATTKSASTVPAKNLNTSPQAAPAPAPVVPYGSPDSPASFDDPSVFSGNTRGSRGTYPTVRTADSEDSKDSAFTITRNGQYLTLNGFANGHLMRWKFAAEEGPAFIRIPAVLLALGVIGTTAFPLVAYDGFWTIPLMICALHTWILALLIIVLEARVIGIRDPTNFRARIRGVITRYINVTRLVWGRGLLYIYCGSMNLTIDDRYVIYTAFPIMALGLIAVGTGAHASYNLDRMKSSLTDEAFLWSKFEANDHDNDNKIDVNGFAELLWSLGLEFDDVYTFKAFQQIDKKRTNKITFEQFKTWWIVTQNDGRRLRS